MNLSDPVLSQWFLCFILSAAPYMADTGHFATTRYTVNLKWDGMDWIWDSISVCCECDPSGKWKANVQLSLCQNIKHSGPSFDARLEICQCCCSPNVCPYFVCVCQWILRELCALFVLWYLVWIYPFLILCFLLWQCVSFFTVAFVSDVCVYIKWISIGALGAFTWNEMISTSTYTSMDSKAFRLFNKFLRNLYDKKSWLPIKLFCTNLFYGYLKTSLSDTPSDWTFC